ncbi:MAG: hypothetical protein HRT44_00535 [Bdellovibrionales bacterium]|nr:hypothetical protein [Bdellovibrionales bacterium]NQZ17738.1 hypothetical protein [Bdellovibrionales bacterium]
MKSILVIITFISLTSYNLFADSVRSPQQTYLQQCINNMPRVRDTAQRICNCVVEELNKKIEADGFNKLLNPSEELSVEEAVRVENVDEETSTVENFEIDVMQSCMEKNKP